MALVLFAILFLLGATGTERRRGIQFSLVTAFLLFAWSIPFVIEDAGTYGSQGSIFQAFVLLVTFPGLALLSFLAGRGARKLVTTFKSKPHESDR